jgi:hypothetical protein
MIETRASLAAGTSAGVPRRGPYAPIWRRSRGAAVAAPGACANALLPKAAAAATPPVPTRNVRRFIHCPRRIVVGPRQCRQGKMLRPRLLTIVFAIKRFTMPPAAPYFNHYPGMIGLFSVGIFRRAVGSRFRWAVAISGGIRPIQLLRENSRNRGARNISRKTTSVWPVFSM